MRAGSTLWSVYQSCMWGNPKQTLEKLDSVCRQNRYQAAVSADGSSKDSGSVLLGLRGLDWQQIPAGTPGLITAQGGHDWTGMILRVKGNSLLLIQTYLTNGLGPAGENLSKMHEMELCIKALGIPFVMAGDLNMQQDELEYNGWASRLNAQVVTPRGVRSTCTNGGASLTPL